MNSRLICVILAVDEGTRMKSDYPKALHKVAGEPILSHVLEAAKFLEASRTIVVVGRGGGELIKSKLPRDIETLHTLIQIKDTLKGFKGEVLVLCGDTPLLCAATLKGLIETHRKEEAIATVLTAILHDPSGYDRIIRKENDRIAKILEEKDATIYEKAVEEVNGKTYCFDSGNVFSSLEEIKTVNRSKKYCLTDVIGLMVRQKKKVLAFMSEDGDEILGVNSRKDLAVVNKILHRRIAQVHMENGVTIVDPETTFIDKKVEIGRDSIIYPFTILEGETVIGERCQIGPGAHLMSAWLGDGVRCRQAVIKDKKVKGGKDIGPYKVFTRR